MKLIRLEIEGINSFRERQTIDFEMLSQYNLFCISGNTGSGKTTILDCIILALYNKLPAYSARGDQSDYINLACDKGAVKLVFSLDGKTYCIERTYSRKKTALARLTDLDEGTVIADKSDDITNFVRDKIGLGVEQFTQVIILQQGAFSKFLRATKKDRNAMVIKLFRLERFEKIYTNLHSAQTYWENVLGNKDSLLAEYEGDTRENLHAAKKNGEAVDAAIKEAEKQYAVAHLTLQKAREEEKRRRDYAEATEKLKRADEEQKALDARRQALEAKSREYEVFQKKESALAAEKENLIKSETSLESLRRQWDDYKVKKQELVKMRGEFKAQQDETNKLKENLADTQRALEKLLGGEGEPASAEQTALDVQRMTADFNAANKYKDIIKEKKAALAEKRQKLGSAMDSLLKARQEADAAKEAVAKARKAAEKNLLMRGADAIRDSLKAGDICPVCGEVLKSNPVKHVAAEVCREDEVEKAERRLESALKNVESCNGLTATLTAENTNLTAALADAEKSLSELPEITAESIDEANRRLVRAREWEKLVDKRKNLKKDCDAAESMQRVLLEKGTQMRKLLDDVNSALKDASEESIAAQLASVRQRRETISNEELAGKALRDYVQREKAAIDSAQAKIDEMRASVKSAVENAPDGSIMSEEEARLLVKQAEDRRIALASEKAAAQKDIAMLSERLEKKRALAAERAVVAERCRKIGKMSKIFAGGDFLAFVATEYIKDFTESASRMLSDLTGGKYTMSYDEESGAFYVADFLRGNEKRKSTTLSGGETFLASLSMATALSREIARFGAFDFFFIDEGFGTLDDGTFDVVTEVLQNLSRTSLVGVVTHRTELTSRMPMTLRVTEADETHGSHCDIIG